MFNFLPGFCEILDVRWLSGSLMVFRAGLRTLCCHSVLLWWEEEVGG